MLTYSFDDRGMDFLYEHLYKEIKNDILMGNLKAHEKLPSKRALAAHLNVSVVTVENAYSQLLAEGYIYSKPKSGFYVCDVKAEDADVVGVRDAYYASEYKGGTEGSVMKDNARQNTTSDESGVAYMCGIRSEDHVTVRPHVIRDHADSVDQNGFFADFVNNSTLSENFPFSTWTKLMRETMMDDREKLMKRSPSGGIFELRKAIADYLYQFPFCGNQYRVSGHLSGIGWGNGVACDLANQTVSYHLAAGRDFFCFCQKWTDGSFAHLVGIPDY